MGFLGFFSSGILEDFFWILMGFDTIEINLVFAPV